MKVDQKFGFLPLLVLVTLATDALASCPRFDQGPPCLEYWRTDAVFIGVANRVVQTPNTTGLMIGPYVRSTVYFTIEEAFKGVGGTALVMELDHCGHVFKEGERYLVYANRNPNTKELDVRAGNTRTRPLSDATADLQYIRGLSAAEPGSRVFGKLVQYTHNMAGSGDAVEALKNIKITLDGNNQQHEVVTDNQGRYEFRYVLPGAYRLRADLPGHLKYDEQRFSLNGRDCLPVDIWAMPRGQIVGRVLDEQGNPLVSVPISVVSTEANLEEIFAEGKRKVSWPYNHTDREGRFRFTHLTPGRYLLVINITQSEAMRGTKAALPRLFYPGVNDHRGATVIEVGKDDQPQEYVFRLAVR